MLQNKVQRHCGFVFWFVVHLFNYHCEIIRCRPLLAQICQSFKEVKTSPLLHVLPGGESLYETKYESLRNDWTLFKFEILPSF